MQMTVEEQDFGLAGSIREIKRRSRGKSFEAISKIGSARVIKTAMHYAPAANAKEMTTRIRLHAAKRTGLTRAGGDGMLPGFISVNVGRREAPYGRVWMLSEKKKWVMVKDAGFRNVNRHFSNGQWTDIQEAVQDYRGSYRTLAKQERPSRGLLKNSFYQGLEALGINHALVPPRFVRYANYIVNATASNGRIYQNGRVDVSLSNDQVLITYTNSIPYAGDPEGVVKYINDAVRTTRKAIEIEIETGVFDNYKVLARRWPILVERD